MSHIFISYRSKESAFALKVAHSLRQAGIPIWMDQLSGIRAGDDWIAALQDGLNNSMAMVAALSPEYVKSTYCLRELQRADALGRPIFPLLIEALPTEDIPLELQRTQYVDFQNWQDEATFQEKMAEFVEVLKDKLKLKPDPAATAGAAQAGIIVPPRQTDEKIAQVQQLFDSFSSGSRLVENKKKRLEERLNITIEKINAVEGQLMTDLNADNRVIIRKKLEQLEAEATEIEAELEKLQ